MNRVKRKLFWWIYWYAGNLGHWILWDQHRARKTKRIFKRLGISFVRLSMWADRKGELWRF